MKKFQLGEFEEVVLLVIGILEGEAYGFAIKEEIEKRLARTVSMGALHSTLLRLEEKSYVKSFAGEATPERAGRPRRYYEITSIGVKALDYCRATREALWNKLPKHLLNLRKA